MKVTVELFGSLRRHVAEYEPKRGIEVEVPAATKIKDLFARLEIPISDRNMVTINGRYAEGDEELTDGASVIAFPFVGGG